MKIRVILYLEYIRNKCYPFLFIKNFPDEQNDRIKIYHFFNPDVFGIFYFNGANF
jgi:hypothetical protein